MTWAEVKKQIEDAGVTDDMEMWYIDISFDSKFSVSLAKESVVGESCPNDIGFSVIN